MPGGFAIMTDVLKMPNETEADQPRTRAEVPVWLWFVATLLLQSAFSIVYTHNDRQNRQDWVDMRKELDENAVLIKQLQERIIVKELASLRKGTSP